MKEQSIEQFTNDLVAEWVNSGKVALRPAEKKTLKNLIIAAVPEFLAVNSSEAFDRYIHAVKQNERDICVKTIAGLPEPMRGLVNKQRAVNACGYAERNKPAPVSAGVKDSQHEHTERLI